MNSKDSRAFRDTVKTDERKRGDVSGPHGGPIHAGLCRKPAFARGIRTAMAAVLIVTGAVPIAPGLSEAEPPLAGLRLAQQLDPSDVPATGRRPGTPSERLDLGALKIIPEDRPIEMSAERLAVDYKDEIYQAKGNVILRQGDLRLRADRIGYHRKDNELTAEGRVIVRLGRGDVIEAERITITLPEATGVVYNGKLLFTGRNIYLEGEKLERVGKSRYRIEKGSFTTCDGPTPDWRISGRDLDVTLEGYGILRHGFFYVRDIPVFYIPWLIYPAKRKRQTGFLLPSLSSSSQKGFDFRLPFFLNINPGADMTITPRICTKRAYQTSLEFRYVPAERFRGRFYGEHTLDWEYGGAEDPLSHRFYVNWQHNQELFDLLSLRVNGNWVSDRDYFELWGGDFDRRKRVRYLESAAVLNRQWENFLFQAEARHFDNLDLPDNAVTVQNLPIVTTTAFNQQIPHTPFFVGSSLTYSHFYAPYMHNQWLGSRVKADTRIRLPISLGRFLKMEPSFTYSPRAYAADYYENDVSRISVNAIRGDIYQFDADLFTDLYRIYSNPFPGFQRIKHFIRPRLGWTFRPIGEPDEVYPVFDESDTVPSMSLITAELRQAVTGRIGPGRYADLMTLRIAQGFDLKRITTEEDLFTRERPIKYGWTDTMAELTVRPLSLFELAAEGRYDPVENKVRSYSVELGLMDHRGDMMSVLHQFVEDKGERNKNRQTNVRLRARVTSSLDFFVENQYTHQYDFSYFTSVGMVYHPQCWSVALKYSEQRELNPVTRKLRVPNQTVFLSVSLYGLGQVYHMTRDWKALMGDRTESIGNVFP